MIVLSSLHARLAHLEREFIIEALNANSGHICETARMLGIHRWQLRRLIDRYELESHVKLHPWAQYSRDVAQGLV